MKKFINRLSAGVLLLGAFACTELEHMEYDVTNAVAPVLTNVDVANAELSDGAVFGTVAFQTADYGVPAAVKYFVYAAADPDFQTEKAVANTTSNSVEVACKDVNNVLISAGAEAGVETSIYLRVKSVMQSESGNIEGASSTLISNSQMVVVTPYNAEKEYPCLYVIGSYNGWATDATQQRIFSFAEDEVNYSGVIGFDGKAGDGWKIKKGIDATWPGDGNWGVAENDTQEAETGEAQLYTHDQVVAQGGGDSKDIRLYSEKSYYLFKFNTSTGKLKVVTKFDQMGLIGLAGDWENDIVMEFNKSKQIFWADVQVADATEFKFRADAAWGYNLGGDKEALSLGGGNIAIEPGNYRIYLNINDPDAIRCEVNADKYGTEEGGEVEPTPEPEFTGWSIIGLISWEEDIDMTQSGDFFVAKGVSIAADSQFKFRKAHGWTENLGAEGDVEPAVVAVGEPVNVVAGGKNISVAEAGEYDIYLNPDAGTVSIMNAGDVPAGVETWGVVGTVNNWGNALEDGSKMADLVMDIDEATGLLARKGIVLTDNDEIKVRFCNDWAVNYGPAASLTVGMATLAKADGSNMKPGAGTYDLYFDLDNTLLYLMPEGEAPVRWGVVGTVNGWGGTPDLGMYWDAALEMYVRKGVVLTADDEVKLRQNSDWPVNRGGAAVVGEPGFAVTNDGANMKPGEGTFDIYYKPADEIVFIMNEGEVPGGGVPVVYADYIHLLGDINNWAFGVDFLASKGSGVYEGFAYIDGQFKFCAEDGSTWYGAGAEAGTLSTDGGADNISLESGYYALKADIENLTWTATPITRIGIIGPASPNGWNEDTALTYDAGSNTWKATMNLGAGEFKFRANSDWTYNWGSTQESAEAIQLGVETACKNNGANFILSEDGTFEVVLKAFCDGHSSVTVTRQ